MEDPELLLEEILLNYIRVAGIFFIGGIALFSFTNYGKEFSIISLLFALVLCIASLIEFWRERNNIIEQGIFPRMITDFLACLVVAFCIFVIWVIYVVWNSEQSSLAKIVRDFEEDVDVTNLELIKAVYESNQQVVNAIKGLPTKELSVSKKFSSPKFSKILKNIGNQDRRVLAGLAAVS